VVGTSLGPAQDEVLLSGASPETSCSRIRFTRVWFCTCATFSRTSRTHSVIVVLSHHVLVTTRQWVSTAQKIKWPKCKRTAPNQNCKSSEGRAVAQAVSRWLPTAVARVTSGQHVRFVVDKAQLGQNFSEYFGFLCQSLFHQFLHHHNHPGLAQWAYWYPQCRMDQIWLHPPIYEFNNSSKTWQGNLVIYRWVIPVEIGLSITSDPVF
jgi:hypothetical protein